MKRSPPSIGGWFLDGELGRGGMGVVYRASRADGAVGALKTVAVGDPRFIDATQREIRALGRVVHPGIVRILDVGLDDGVPWYVMELLEGRAFVPAASPTTTMRTWGGDGDAEAVRGGGHGHPHALELALALCGPLAALHAAGLVHRDLKPDNLLLRADDTLVIADFGLSVTSGGRDDLGDGPRAAGTLAYMSPEQIRGEPVDARSDLYALGCLLYELLTGSPPFLGPADWVRTAHLTDRPLPPGQIAPLSPGVDELVMRLLAKSPRERPSHAIVVARELRALGARGDVEETPNVPLLRASFAGRDDVVARLSTDAGRVWLLTGPAGSGKTRVARHLVGATDGRPVVVGTGRGRRPVLLRAVDEAFVLATRREETRRLAQQVAPALAALVPAAAALAAPLPPLVGSGERHRLLQAIRDLLAGLGPTLVVLEDLHHGDELTLAFLQAIATRPAPFCVVGTARDDADSAALARLRAAPGITEVALAPLGPAAMAGMAAEQLGTEVLPPDLEALATACAGNPLLLGEALLAWTSGHRDLVRGDDGDLQRLVEARLAAVDPDARRVLAAVVVLDENATTARIAQVAGLSDESATETLGALVRARLLEDRDEGLVLACEPLGGWVLADAAERRAAHAAAAEAVANTGDDAAIGHHRAAAGDGASAVPYLLRAAASAAAQGLPEVAVGAWGTALSFMPEPSSARCEALRGSANALRLLGRTGAATATGAQSVADARAIGDPTALVQGLIALSAVERTGQPELAQQGLTEAVTLARDASDLRLEGIVLGHLGALHAQQDDWAHAGPVWERALACAEAVGDVRQALRIRGDLAMLADIGGQLDEALAMYLATAAAQQALEHWLEAAFTLGNLAVLYLKRGEPDLALATAEQALATKRAYGYRRGEALELLSIADIHQQQGRFAEAIHVGADARVLLDELGETGWSRKITDRMVAWGEGRTTPVE